MATRQEYNTCMAKGMRGKKLTKEERALEFCVVAKLCSGKSKTEQEARLVCSQPKEPKPAKTSRQHKPQSCEKDVLKVARCVADNINMDQASNINSIEMAVANALMECQCPSRK
jgi:hypothetical protein